MRISNISIRNFRGISSLDSGDLGDTIIIAGQNGSGKSCIFDAIRLLKSVYGGYQQNEYQHFFNEFQIQLTGGSQNLRGLFNDPSKAVTITAEFELRDREKAYINANAAELLEETIWQRVLPEAFQWGGYHKAMFAAQFRDRQPEVTKAVNEQLPALLEELAKQKHLGQTIITPDGNIVIVPSAILTVIFTTYRPREIGVIDFHGAQRHYSRENVQGINLSLDQVNQTRSQSSLYNYNAKYSNVKSEMAGNYVKELLAEKAQGELYSEKSLVSTMQELFSSFFPDKEFLGPKPQADGSLSFPVRTQNGHEHDLDELSSGEKEILYGYLRIRSSAPKDSIVLLDEPELHLNPRLIRGLPDFYKKHLSEALENQLWLVTHSDALIREAVGKPGFNVFHMLPCGAESPGTSQLRPLVAVKDLDFVLTDLVGDLAAYRPGGKAVIFEGGGDSDFDKSFVGALFSTELRGINLLSGSNKAKVKALHEVLQRAYEHGDLPTKFYAVVDQDSDPIIESESITQFSWDVYHVENYLLDPDIIADCYNAYFLDKKIDSSAALNKLQIAARNIVKKVLVQKMREFANSRIISTINLGFDPETLTITNELFDAIERSFNKMTKTVVSDLTKEKLAEREQKIRNEIEESFSDGTWRKNFPGRDILRQFVAAENVPTNYEAFRNQIVTRMASLEYKPEGMKNIIDQIVKD